MLFNSFSFVIFFVCVYAAYLFLQRTYRWQNVLLLIASYVFYASWDWKMLPLLLSCTAANFFFGAWIHGANEPWKKRLFLFLGIASTLGVLIAFKYLGVFLSAARLITGFGHFPVSQDIFQLAVPVGISFFSFQSLTYIIDIYRGQLEPTKDPVSFALFVSFFPLILSGPIERARRLLPQLSSLRPISYESIYEGIYLVIWGWFEKSFIADNLVRIVSQIFDMPSPYSGNAVLVASYAFTFQIFCDFDGYSNMARGLCKLMNIDVMVNFNLPFFATNIQDYWKRWHISLSLWIKDYVYLPLFLSLRNVGNVFRLYIALIVTMIIMGLWHGPSWTYVLWGLYQGFLLATYALLRPYLQTWFNPKGAFGKKAWLITRMFFMFNITALGMLIFRAKSLDQVFQMLQALFTHFNLFPLSGMMREIIKAILHVLPLMIIQGIQYKKNDILAALKFNVVVSAIFFYLLIYTTLLFGEYGSEHLYFKY